MKTISAISIYLALTILNPAFATTNKQTIQFTGSLYYGISEKHSTLHLKHIPKTFHTNDYRTPKVYTLAL